MKVNGKMTKKMEKVLKNFQMAVILKVIIKMVNQMELVAIIGQMVNAMMENG
jgi:hypothetical protein